MAADLFAYRHVSLEVGGYRAGYRRDRLADVVAGATANQGGSRDQYGSAQKLFHDDSIYVFFEPLKGGRTIGLGQTGEPSDVSQITTDISQRSYSQPVRIQRLLRKYSVVGPSSTFRVPAGAVPCRPD
ncbi:hypothetical protein D3C77_616310 [compost metagenome]